MKYFLILTGIFTTVLFSSQAVKADIMWADSVADYTSNIQNYTGDKMSAATEFWATGAPDADVDGNGYLWDTADLDYIAGWRSNAAGEYLVVYFNTALPDVVGDDLHIYLTSGENAGANVLASVDGGNYTQIGAIGPGIAGDLRDDTFDFAGLFESGVHYVKLERVGNGSKSGMFFDAIGGETAVPEPGTLVLLLTALGFFVVRKQFRT